MSYKALYREWRPLVFEDVVEQEHVVKTLKHSVDTGRIAHAYLFCGTRGTGKTSLAHIMSRAVNCLYPDNGNPCNECEICRGILSGSSTDVLEIDAASNNSVDNVREIREEVIYSPSSSKYKVYIIDEVHMLSTGAFNALLKTLEEPPAHVVFILATTEPHKLPATILSRCQRFDFRRISVDSIVKRLEKIAGTVGVRLDSDASRLMAKMSDGALRDAISLLDQCISLGNEEISYNDVLSVAGVVNDAFITEIVDNILNADVDSVLEKVNRLVMEGRDIQHFISDLVYYYRNLLICSITANPSDIADIHGDMLEAMKKQCRNITQDEIIYSVKELSSLESELKWAVSPRVMLEVALIRLCRKVPGYNGSVFERLEALESRIAEAVPLLHKQDPDTSGQTGAPDTKTKSYGQSTETVPPPSPSGKDAGQVPPGRKTGTKTHEEVKQWPAVIDDLKSLGRMSIYSFLTGTRAVSLEGNYIGIVFGPEGGFAKMALSRAENIEVVESAAARVLGRQVKIKCLDETVPDNSNTVAAVPADKDDPVEKVRMLTEKAGVPFEVIDE